MKYLIVIIFTLISGVKLPISNHGIAQTPEMQYYVLTNSLAQGQVWKLDTNTSQAIEIFSLPVYMPNETFRDFMPEHEIKAAQEYFQSLQLSETQYEKFLDFEVFSYIRKIDVSDSGNKIILLVTHETCHRYFNDTCFGISQLILLTEADENVVWEHAYHDPNPDFLANDCSTNSTLAYKSQIISLDGWTSDEQGFIVGLGGDLCFVNDNRPYVMVPLVDKPAFTLMKGYTPVHSPRGNQWASINRSCRTSYDCQDSLVVVDVNELEVSSTNSTTIVLDDYNISAPDEIQWNANNGIQFKVADQLQGSQFLATVNLETATIDYLAIHEPFALKSGTTTTSLAWSEAGMLTHLEIQGDDILFTPFYNEPITAISMRSDGFLMIQGQQDTQYQIINGDGEILEEIDLLDYFLNADDYTRIELAW